MVDDDKQNLEIFEAHLIEQLHARRKSRWRYLAIYAAVLAVDGAAISAIILGWETIHWVLNAVVWLIAASCTLWLVASIVVGDCRECFLGPEIYVNHCNHWLRAYRLRLDPDSSRLLALADR
ncbi:hypothetical protein AAMO2058_000127500 [Amorphochlora amoebiformis]|uniref:Uncharacterized protein n=1 Tax=Amorphochlora amoebiformis TaxID=1561963 RepID=A0A7S0GPE7_9EUKA|mmetsp:Transcript_10299/g.16243  ORF Transcript_10299/g.16243 Transcript_10299/m.16243 type:complete len:122 (+) Transcript_10299:32-397(+)